MKFVEVNLTKENLIKIQDIDASFHKNAITGIHWYLERYNENHKGILLLDENNNTVGYIVSVPIKKELYDAITNGVIINDLHINPKMFVNKSEYNYIVSCVLLEKYRKQGYASIMLSKLLEKAKGKYCALTITKGGYNLAKKYLDFKMNVYDEVNVFVKDYNIK